MDVPKYIYSLIYWKTCWLFPSFGNYNVSVNIYVWVFVWTYVFNSFRYIAKSMIARLYGKSVSNL